MIPISEFNTTYHFIKHNDTIELNNRCFRTVLEFLVPKFPEASSIFRKFDAKAIQELCNVSTYTIYEENSKVNDKGEECDSYLFLLSGDLNLFEGELTAECSKLLKTIPAGSIYGHKMKGSLKNATAAKNLAHILKIKKDDLGRIIESTNTRKDIFKMKFLKKYFPKLRMIGDEVLNTLKGYFIRENYKKNSKIFYDGENDEFCYLIIKGEVGLIKSIKKIGDVKRYLDSTGDQHSKVKYVLLELLKQGDIFGMYSALKHRKNNHTAIALSEEVELYKISKSHILYYFGGSNGLIPETLRGIDQMQQASMRNKIDYLTQDCEGISRFNTSIDLDGEESTQLVYNYVTIDETLIEDTLKDAWKEGENLESKISSFKANLFKPKATETNQKSLDIFSKFKDKEDEAKDNTKVMGFGTMRVVGRTLNKNGLTNTQMKGVSVLKSFCKEKEKEEDQDAYLNKIANVANKGESSHKSKLTSFGEDDDKKEDITAQTQIKAKEEAPKEEPVKVKKKPGMSLKGLIE